MTPSRHTHTQAAVHVNLGYVYAEGGGQGLYPGAMQKAADVFKASTKLLPTFVEAYTYWGNALQEMGDIQASSQVFSDAIDKFVKGKGKGSSPLSAPLPLPSYCSAGLPVAGCCKVGGWMDACATDGN